MYHTHSTHTKVSSRTGTPTELTARRPRIQDPFAQPAIPFFAPYCGAGKSRHRHRAQVAPTNASPYIAITVLAARSEQGSVLLLPRSSKSLSSAQHTKTRRCRMWFNQRTPAYPASIVLLRPAQWHQRVSSGASRRWATQRRIAPHPHHGAQSRSSASSSARAIAARLA